MDIKKYKITPEEASKVVGITAARIRNIMKWDYLHGTKRLPIGAVIPPESDGGKYQFLIYKQKVLDFIGADSWPEE